MIDERICPVCELPFCPNCSTHKYCSEACAEEGNRQWHKQNYRDKLKAARIDPRNQQWELKYDPDPCGLFPGLMLSQDEVRAGLRMKIDGKLSPTYTNGTILYNRKKRITYRVEGNKLRMVEATK